MKINTILLKPLDGFPVGAPRSFDKNDFEALRRMGAVREATDDDEKPASDDGEEALLERLRHATDGPKLLAEMRASFEAMGRERDRLIGELDTANKLAEEAARDRDAAIAERDDARAATESVAADRDALQAKIDQAQADAAKAEKSAPKKSGAQA